MRHVPGATHTHHSRIAEPITLEAEHGSLKHCATHVAPVWRLSIRELEHADAKAPNVDGVRVKLATYANAA
jgi:hypothetical protein